MFPLYDTIRSRRPAVVTKALVILNVLVFFYELHLGDRLQEFFLYYGIVPIRYSRQELAEYFTFFQQILPFFTSMFLHGGWLHLISNMWMLWIFGDNVEDRLGRWKFLLFYVSFGLAGGILHLLTDLHSVKPMIGASGAIAGVMGAYFIMFPHARVMTAVPIFVFITFLEIPVPVFLAFWFLTQFFSGALSLIDQSDAFGGVAWWAHIGGFAAGMVIGILYRRSKFRLNLLK
ncbi:MAG: rhomboid family intramembrane serine protease [Candidatus Omnitrophota bacterium]|jgi:membrane associated rhomboid family serine protease|nr:MAG: rhomboid family intramembrane serine protease [Candidatus Omnitrophota bacterium]